MIGEVINGQSYSSIQLIDIINNDTFKKYMPENSPFEEFIDEILLKMVRV